MSFRTKKVKFNRYIRVALITLLFQILSLQASIAVETEAAYPELPSSGMRISAYTKDFAKRFGLPDPVPGTEPGGGLEAIEFAIEKGRFSPYYFCKFSLYVSNKLPIKYPEEGVAGAKYMLVKGTHFFGRTQDQWMNWPKKDRLHFNDRQGSYHRKANLATMDYAPGKEGAITSLYYREFHKDILPGIAYINLDCSPPSFMIKNLKNNIGIWLQKESDVDYRGRFDINSENFLKFKLPDPVYQKVREWGLQAKKFNDRINEIRKKNNAGSNINN